VQKLELTALRIIWEGSTTVVYVHCRLARFRGYMIREKSGAMIGSKEPIA